MTSSNEIKVLTKQHNRFRFVLHQKHVLKFNNVLLCVVIDSFANTNTFFRFSTLYVQVSNTQTNKYIFTKF